MKKQFFLSLGLLFSFAIIFTACPRIEVVGTETTYTVNHFLQNIDDDEYVLKESKKITGNIGETTAAVANTYTGFTAKKFSQETIEKDITEVNIYYDRNIITYTFILNNGNENIILKGKYGAPVTAPVPEKKGFTFNGWDAQIPEKFSVENKSFTADWKMSEPGDEPEDIQKKLITKIITIGNPEINVNTNTSANTITFTAEEGYDTYEWVFGNELNIVSEINTVTIDYENYVNGTYYLWLTVKKGNYYYSDTFEVTVSK